MTAVTATSTGRREWIGLAVIPLPCLLLTMALDVLYLAAKAERGSGPEQLLLLWISDIYGLDRRVTDHNGRRSATGSAVAGCS
jgi:DHA2 family multidrug resistance protein-like MFS transporter